MGGNLEIEVIVRNPRRIDWDDYVRHELELETKLEDLNKVFTETYSIECSAMSALLQPLFSV